MWVCALTDKVSPLFQEEHSLLPPHVLRESKADALTREEMRSQISEFLLEGDVDNI